MNRAGSLRPGPVTAIVLVVVAVASEPLPVTPGALAHSYNLEDIAIGRVLAPPPEEKGAILVRVVVKSPEGH